MPNIAEKMSDISLVMSDAFYFVQFRNHVEDIQAKANEGNAQAMEFMERFETIYRLAKVCLK